MIWFDGSCVTKNGKVFPLIVLCYATREDMREKDTREKGKRENWGENKTDVDENGVGKKGVREIRLFSLDLVSSLSVNVFLVLFVLATSVLAI